MWIQIYGYICVFICLILTMITIGLFLFHKDFKSGIENFDWEE